MVRCMIAFGEDWGGLPSSTQHIMSRLADDRDVIWVNSIGMRRPRLDRRDLSRILSKVGALTRRGASPVAQLKVTTPSRLSIISPMAVSWPGCRMAEEINRVSVGRQIRNVMMERHLKDPIIWTSLPTALPIIGELGKGPVVYYCGDDFSALAGVDHKPVAELEKRLVDRADLIFAASDALVAKFPSVKTVLAPHGVDFDHFRTPAPRADDLPASGRIAGFYGSIAEWIDIEMIASCARQMPDWTFVLIGKPQVDVGVLAALPNVRLLGPRPHEALPGYVQHWDVSLLPFRDSPQIRACNPLKLREYLAAGTPIAAIDFPALGPYRDLVSFTSDPAKFHHAILSAKNDARPFKLRRMRVASESWEARAEAINTVLEQL